MIKPNELRIGNYVQWSDKPGFYEQWMHCHWIGTFTDIYPFPEPIPLTSDWLLMFGFKLVGSQTYEKTCGDDFTIKVEDDQHCGTALFLEGSGAIPIDSVHQLQNIVHSITGEELTIQE